MRKRATGSWKKLLAEAKNLNPTQLAEFKKAVDVHCDAVLSEQEAAASGLREAIAADPAKAPKAPKAPKGEKVAKTPRKAGRKATKKAAGRDRKAAAPKAPAKAAKTTAAGAPRRGRAGAEEARDLVYDALKEGPMTINELVDATGCVRITVDKYLKAGIKARKIKKAGKRGRAQLFELA